MNSVLVKLAASPMFVRVAPFVLFAALTSLQGVLGEASRYWLYLAKTLTGVGLIWWMRPRVAEMRWACSWEALVAGIAVFGLWVGLDGLYPAWAGPGKAWNPHAQFGPDGGWAWAFIVVRLVGAALIVPPLEEVFYRSFLYRYIAKPDFQSLPLHHFAWMPLLVTAGIFGAVHPNEWLAGILCGLIYQGLVIRKRRLGDALTAHAITNFLLGLWVVGKGAWKFW